MSRLKERYEKEVIPALKKEFGYTNVMAVPKIEKVVVNMGLGEATSNVEDHRHRRRRAGAITGQKPVTRRAEEVDRAVQGPQGPARGHDRHAARRAHVGVPRSPDDIALPRVRDFKGVSPKASTGAATTRSASSDQLLFPEIDYMKVDKARGMNVSVVTTAKTDEEARKLLQFIGMPFRQKLMAG